MGLVPHKLALIGGYFQHLEKKMGYLLHSKPPDVRAKKVGLVGGGGRIEATKG